jgi:hypothetical protein
MLTEIHIKPQHVYHMHVKEMNILACLCNTELAEQQNVFVTCLEFIIVWEICPTVIRDVLHRRKLSELWLTQNLEHRVEVCLKN